MIEELKRFILVAQAGNLTKTAEKIFITQSALTQSIHRLEKELHTKLFIQKGKHLQLTNEGKSLVILGEKILQLWENAHDPQIGQIQKPTYTIGMFDNVALRLGKFFQHNLTTHQYKLELKIDSSVKLLTQLQLGTLDAAICIFNKNYHLPNHITLLQTYSEKLIPVSSQSFSSKLETIPFILYNKSSHTRIQIDELFIQNNVRPTIYAESTSVTFMRELAILGYGVALLPKNFVKQDLDQGRLKKIKMPIHWERTYALYLNNTGLLSLTHPLTNALQKELKKLTR